ncbi:MAG: CoA transferase [Actinomycetota bacterium]|nr:CoA transferase [Actinomycetota bacterium]
MAEGGESTEVRQKPLEGIRVLDLSSLMAGPVMAMHLADFGADVIKVEQPGRGDELRRWGLSKNGVPLMFKLVNRNKRVVTANMRVPEGQEIVRRLAATADVVIENFRPGTLERWGLGYEQLSDINPRLVMVRVTGYGQTGPSSQRRGFGTIVEGISGFAALTGMPGGPPLLPSFGLGDTSTAIFGAYAAMLGLFHAQRIGRGQYVDLALYDGLIMLLGSHIIDYDQLGFVPPRLGSRTAFVAPRNIYPTGDGEWVVIAGSTQKTFLAILDALDLQELGQDPRFATNSDRLQNVEVLDELISKRLMQLSQAEVLKRLEDSGAAVGPIYDVEDVLEDEQMQHRNVAIAVDDPELGTIRMQNVAVRLSATPGEVRWSGPEIGAHNREVLGGELGFSDGELEDLRARGVI